MPIYEYRCGVCQHQFEVRQGFNDDPIAQCPKCSASVQRVIQPVGVVFKGGGWYSTDSRRSSTHSIDTGHHDHGEGSHSHDNGDHGHDPSKESSPPTPSSTPSAPSPSKDAAPASSSTSSPD